MNLLDIFILIPLVWFTWRGFTKGLIIELATLVALFVGIYFGSWLSGIVADFLKNSFGMTSQWVPIISYAVTFILIIVGVFALAKMLEKSANLLTLGLINKLMGAVFGMLKTLLIVSLIFFLINKTGLIPEKTKDGSLLYQHVSKIAPVVFTKLKSEAPKEEALQQKK